MSPAEGVVFVDTRDLPLPEAVLPATPMKDPSSSSSQHRRPPCTSSSSAGDTCEDSGYIPVSPGLSNLSSDYDLCLWAFIIIML